MFRWSRSPVPVFTWSWSCLTWFSSNWLSWFFGCLCFIQTSPVKASGPWRRRDLGLRDIKYRYINIGNMHTDTHVYFTHRALASAALLGVLLQLVMSSSLSVVSPLRRLIQSLSGLRGGTGSVCELLEVSHTGMRGHMHTPDEGNGHEEPVGCKSQLRLGRHVVPVTRQLVDGEPLDVLREEEEQVFVSQIKHKSA